MRAAQLSEGRLPLPQLTYDSFKAWLAHQKKRARAGQHRAFDNDFDFLEDDLGYEGEGKIIFEGTKDWALRELPDPIPVWRGLRVPNFHHWVSNPVVKQGHLSGIGPALKAHVGVCWAYERGGAIDVGDWARGSPNVVLVGSVPKTSVDWYCTIALTIVDPEEKEIRLLPRAPVFVSEIEILTQATDDPGYFTDQPSQTIPVNRSLRA